MITKQPARKKDAARVTFALPRDFGGDAVYLCGDWNAWQTTHPLKRHAPRNGDWRLALDLKRGAEYQFRYVVDGRECINDPAADKYVPNPFGSENSEVVA